MFPPPRMLRRHLCLLITVFAITTAALLVTVVAPGPAAAQCLEGGQSCSSLTNCCAGCSGAFSGTCNQCRKAKESCTGLLRGNCCNGMQCDFLGECRNVPSKAGELCGAGVPCGTGLLCFDEGLRSRCRAPGEAGDECLGLGQGTCGADLVCDLRGECRHDPPKEGEPCGGTVDCDDSLVNLSCSAIVGGRCEACGSGNDSCFGLGGGTCCDGLACDVVGRCRHIPSREGEPCGAGVPCDEDLELRCTATVGGICSACKGPGAACVGLGQGNCCADDGENPDNPLVCDIVGECRHTRPLEGEPCGYLAPCRGVLVCDASVGGRCTLPTAKECSLGQTCAGGVCDIFCGECRAERPLEGEVCGLDALFGAQCKTGLTCRAAFPCNRCEAEKGIGQRCSTDTQCLPGLECWAFENRCYPIGERGTISAETCNIFYSPEIHAVVIAEEETRTYSTAAIASGGISSVTETGVIYSSDGRYGCFRSVCDGVETTLGQSAAACTGSFDSYDAVAGPSDVNVLSIGLGPVVQVGHSIVQTPFDSGDPVEQVGSVQCVSVGADFSPPLSVGRYRCTTTVSDLYDELTTSAPSGVAGDSDGDGMIMARDALAALRSVVGAGVRCPTCVCDLNGSGHVTASDALLSLQEAVELEPEIVEPECTNSALPTTTTTTIP